MTHRFLTATLAALAFAAAAPVFADEPGPGGTKPPKPKNGAEIYQMVCQACHMADAKGGAGAAVIPALASNPRLAAPAYPIMLVEKGRGAMPYFYDTLTTAQVAEVITYVRTHFGNNYPTPVTAADVEKFAPASPH